MPDQGPASEFGGKIRKNRTQPPPHDPLNVASEQLMLTYTTGDPTGHSDPIVGEEDVHFEGLLPRKVQTELRRQAGDLDKGQVWEEMGGDAT